MKRVLEESAAYLRGFETRSMKATFVVLTQPPTKQVSPQYLCDIEKGSQPTYEDLKRASYCRLHETLHAGPYHLRI